MNESHALFTIRPVFSIDDPSWPAWRDIYFDSFPLDEQLVEAHFLNLFDKIREGKKVLEQVLVMEVPSSRNTHGNADVVAIAFIEEVPSLGIFLLWYLATVADKRNQGYGSYFYHRILDKVKDDQLNLLLFEVEIPETADESVLASRRIDWYHRLGAKLLQGIKYMQFVNPDIPPKEMFLMAHQLTPTNAETIFTNAKAYFGEQLEQFGELTLS